MAHRRAPLRYYRLWRWYAAFSDVQEYLLIILGYANPDVLEKNIEPVIDVLPSADMLKQETLLGAIFSV